MRSATAARLAALLLLAAGAAGASPDPADIARRMQAVMGGDAYDASRVLRFTFAVERGGERVGAWMHTWDRWTGDYRLEGVDRERDNAPLLALFNVHTQQGRVWLDGDLQEGEELERYLERAYGRFINDTYWLLMPWKWLDPGVNLALREPADVDGKPCDVVELTFGDVGLTSGDRYLAYVDRATGLMVRWAYVLQQEDGSPGTGEPTVWNWEGWRRVEPGVWFAERKVRQGGETPVAILTDAVELVAKPTDEQLAAWFQAP